MNKNKYGQKSSPEFRSGDWSKGQALVLVMAIVLIASVVIFMVFNSGRAVNEKINLVNAADAAAYSGAQIAARQLNFMAYTNRAMIANELAVGHMFSYQMEIDIITQSFSAVTDFIQALFGWFPVLGPLIVGFFDFFSTSVLDGIAQINNGVSGIYAAVIEANNAMYSQLQYEVYKDLAFTTDGETLITAAMAAVLKDYEIQPKAPISLNDSDVLDTFEFNQTAPEIQAAARAARDMNANFCEMILFVRPGVVQGGAVGNGNEMKDFCQNQPTDGSKGTQLGSAGNPMSDNGAMLDVLSASVSSFGNADWINDRNSNYAINVFGFNFNITREGNTEVAIDPTTGGLNWRSNTDSIRIGAPFSNLQLAKFNASGDIASTSKQIMSAIDALAARMLLDQGVCGDDADASCEGIFDHAYTGTTPFAHLNEAALNSDMRVTAFLSQSSCSDTVGTDKSGDRLQNWRDNVHFLDDGSVCTRTVYAVSQAEIYFERPPCDGVNSCEFGFSSTDDRGGYQEQANFFNPFWQVRLLPVRGS